MVEDEAIEQIQRMCDYPMTEGSKIRIMPDVHAGKGCTIGTTMISRGYGDYLEKRDEIVRTYKDHGTKQDMELSDKEASS